MLTNLKLYDFRNHTEKSFDFTAKNVVFYGDNGLGKTNVLEAISILSVGKSWRETHASDLINHQASSAKISAQINDDLVDVLIEPRRRQFLKNEKKIPLKTHFGRIPSLLFVPEHLGLFSGAKTERQKYFDRFLFQIFTDYRQDLSIILRAIKQKNQILKSDFVHKDLLAPWNRILAERIPNIIKSRKNFLTALNPIFEKELSKITGKNESINIRLQLCEDFTPTPDGVADFFKKNFNRELAAKRNLISPTRDDFVFNFRDKPLLSTASRGEERSILLALLAAKKHFLTQQNPQKKIILLLDDVFSELDNSRQTALEQICENSQIFFTTTHLEHFAGFQKNVQKFDLY